MKDDEKKALIEHRIARSELRSGHANLLTLHKKRSEFVPYTALEWHFWGQNRLSKKNTLGIPRGAWR